jgi:hypothetical protein
MDGVLVGGGSHYAPIHPVTFRIIVVKISLQFHKNINTHTERLNMMLEPNREIWRF